MAGGMNRRDGEHVAPIGVRAGMIEDMNARPWELPTAAPRDGHAELDVDGAWVQALIIEQRLEAETWVCRVVWAERGTETRVRNEWVPATRIRPRSS